MLTVFFAGAATSLNAALSQELDQRLDEILRSLHEIKKNNDYSTEQFLNDIKSVSVEFYKGRLNTIDPSVSPLKAELIALANRINKAESQAYIKEIEGWYGGYVHEMPNQYLEVYRERGARVLRKLGRKQQSLDQLRESLSKGSQQDQTKAIPYSPPIAELRDNHAVAEYLVAWKFWLMAPPSKERDFMRGRINQALQKIGDESVIPLLVETLTIEIKRAKDERIKKGLATASINLVCSMPSEQSLDALLKINRYAIANDLNGEDYYKSISRHITRRLTSRRAYADQLIDPKMKATIDRQGYNEKTEDIPLTDELWKKYKPLVEARLEAKTDETPQADIELIKSALEIMPKG